MGLNNEINNINRSIKENQQNAERLQRMSDNRQNQKIILQNALLGAILDGLNNNENIYDDNFISYAIDASIDRSEVENNDITKEYARYIYYTVANKATSAHKKENEQTPKELTAYQVERLKLARERLELQRQKEADRLTYERQKLNQQQKSKSNRSKNKTGSSSIIMLLFAPLFILWGILESIAKSK